MSLIRAFLAIAVSVTAIGCAAGTANADPAGATPNDEGNGQLFCDHLNRNPTVQGFRATLDEMVAAGLDEDTAVDAVAYGLLNICPQYRPLLRAAAAGQSPR